MDIMDIRELIGKRCLIETDQRFAGIEVREVRILEVSPSGEWAKTLDNNGIKNWQTRASLFLVEVLVDLRGKRED